MLRTLLICLAVAFAAPAAAQEKKAEAKKAEAKTPTAQQQKHAECNRQSSKKKLSGEARKQFMTECLKT